MALVFAALVPHTPFLLDHIGKENTKKLEKTREAMAQLTQEMYAAHLDTVVVISPHAGLHNTTFMLAGNDELGVDLTEFGDLQKYQPFFNELTLVNAIREMGKRENIPIALNSDPAIDYASAIPLLLMRSALRKNTISIIGTRHSARKDHYDFGYALKDIFFASRNRIGILVSSDLSHSLHTDAPSGYSPFGEQFDASIRDRLKDYNAMSLLTLDEEIVEGASQCALGALLILLGILKRVRYTYKELCYEHPFGVGYLTAQFELH